MALQPGRSSPQWLLLIRINQYFTDALSISAHDAIKLRKREEWESILEDFITCPQRSANHLVLGMNKEQREEAMGLEGNSNVKTWV